MRAVLRDIARERRISLMGGFAKLKNDFEQYFKILDPFVNGKTGPIDKQQQDAFRFLYLRCLFEINGNLDSIELTHRAILEQIEKTRSTALAIVEAAMVSFQARAELLVKSEIEKAFAELKTSAPETSKKKR
jgi:hypothetical protein